MVAKTIVAVLMLVLAVFGAPGRAVALSCLSPEAMIERSELVFSGTVVQRLDDVTIGPSGEPLSVAVVEVDQVWKGRVAARVVLTMDPVDTESEPDLLVGETFAHLVVDDRQLVNECNTWPVDWIVEILGPGSPVDPTLEPEVLADFAVLEPTPPPTVTGPEVPDSDANGAENWNRRLLLGITAAGATFVVLGLTRLNRRNDGEIAEP